jgi:protein-disulfide isomerase
MADEITINKTTFNKLLAVLVVLAIALSFGAGYVLGGVKQTGAAVQQTTQQTTQQQTQQQQTTQLAVGDAPVLGNRSAPVTIIEFSDFSCPYCAAASGDNQAIVDYFKNSDPTWQPAVPGIINDYVNTGKVQLAFKYFPGHGTGPEAMKIALCANEQGKFWDVHNLFFSNQDSITDVNKLLNLTAQTGVDMAKLNQCYSSGKYGSRLTADQSEGSTAGVSGTPTFFIGSPSTGWQTVVGAQAYSVVKNVIDQQLLK